MIVLLALLLSFPTNAGRSDDGLVAGQVGPPAAAGVELPPPPTASPGPATGAPSSVGEIPSDEATGEPSSTAPETAAPAIGPAATARTSSATGRPARATPGPAPTPASPLKTVTVSAIPDLLAVLADNTVDVIVVRDGTYHVSRSNAERSDSLWIGKAYAGRTRPILVRAETRGGVTFDGGGGSAFGGLSFEAGAHHQTWDGFTFANMTAEETGIIEVGGYVPRAAPHHITLRSITITRSCHGRATSATAPTLDHAVYISNAAGTGPHDLRFEDISIDGRGGLASAFHFDHGDGVNPNATGVVVRRLHVTGTQQAIILWLPKVRNVVFDRIDIHGALSHAIRFESVGGTDIVFSHIDSTGSGAAPFYSTMGSSPLGVTFIDTSLD